ncbi:MAG: hypothetical protein PHI12_14385, partial [Dehalococcoidales bacterium]|nr:hypothetical protein [Dehalococcoidales bacterium]
VGIGTTTPSAKLAVTGNAMIDGDLSFLGDQTISGSGTLTLNPAGNLELQSSANYIDEEGNLVVSGRVDADTLQYSGSITINATSSGATAVLVTNADGRAVADLQIEGDIEVQGGKLTLADGETISAETSDHIIITSGGTQVLDIISGGVNITGGATTSDRLYVTAGGADITGRVDIAGLTTIAGDASITGNVTTTGALVVQNGADIAGVLSSDQLTVSGQTDLQGSVLNTAGNFTISDTVDMSGDLNLTGNSASVAFSGTGDHLLSVTSGTLKLGTSTLAGNVTGAGYQISGLGQLTVDNLKMDGNTLEAASGDLVLDSDSGTTRISDSLIITGLLEVQGDFASSSFAGQVELFGTPDGTAVDQGSLYVNPATAGVNNTLLGVAVSDVQKMRFDAEGDMEISGTFSSTGAGTSQFSGGLSVLGGLALGDEASDIIDVGGRFSSSLVPSEDAAYTLGLPDYRWSNFYVATATIDNLIAGGSASSTFIINTGNTSADAEDSQLEFERGSASPNAVFKWNSAQDRFEFNDFSVYMANSLNVAGDETSSFAGPVLFAGTPLGTGVGQGSLYINPSSGLSDYTVFSVAVNDNERFRVDAEGDTTVQGSLGIENYIYDITQDTLLINDDLQVEGGDIKDAGGNIRITLGATNTITGNLAVSTGYITGANSEQIILGAVDNKVQVVRGGSTYTVCDSSGNCQSADGGYIGGLGNDNYLTKFTGSYSVGDSIVYDNGSQVGIGTTTPSRKLTVEGKIFAAEQGTAPGEVITAGRILTAGTGLSGGGDLTQDRTFSVDYGSAAGTAVEGDTQVTVTAGDAVTGGGTITLGAGGSVTLNHQDTSTQASVDNSDGTVIQDITLDTYGHLTAITSYDLDNRYYTETESDSRFVNVTGDTMSGNLTMTGTAANVILGSNWLSGDGDDEGVYVDSLGQVGIGTTTPQEALSVAGNITGSGNLVLSGTVDTGQGATEVYLMDQDVQTTDAVAFATVNTGYGDNELYAMDQPLRTTDSVAFGSLALTYGLSAATGTFSGALTADSFTGTVNPSNIPLSSTNILVGNASNLASSTSALVVTDAGDVGIGTT